MVNPVLVKDLRGNLFRRKPVLAVALMALAILALTLGISVLPSLFGLWGQQDQLPLWRFPDLLLPIIAPAFAAGAFAKEYEQRTWQDLALTRLTALEILRGKFWACLLPTFTAIIVLFPPFALVLIMNNMEWAMEPGPWMLVVLLKFVISSAFYVSVCLVCSFYSNNFRTALVVAYVALAIYGMLNYVLWKFFLTPLFFPIYDRSDLYAGGSDFSASPA